MGKETGTDIQRVEKNSATAAPEQTRPGPVYTPAADIFETDAAITVLADMPGVKASDLKIDLRDNVLTLMGLATSPETGAGAQVLMREYGSGMFFRQFTLGETIEQSKIDAKLSDGVLRLELPKLERARPRQITVKAH